MRPGAWPGGGGKPGLADRPIPATARGGGGEAGTSPLPALARLAGRLGAPKSGLLTQLPPPSGNGGGGRGFRSSGRRLGASRGAEPAPGPRAQLRKRAPVAKEPASQRRLLGSPAPTQSPRALRRQGPSPVTQEDAEIAANTPRPRTLIQTRSVEPERPAPLAEASLGAAESAREQAGVCTKEPQPGLRGRPGRADRGGVSAVRWLAERSQAGCSRRFREVGLGTQETRRNPTFGLLKLCCLRRGESLRWARSGRAGCFHASGPGNGFTPPPAWLCAGAARREGGSLGPPSGARRKGGQTWSPKLGGGRGVELQHPPLERGGSPLKRDLADKEIRRVPRKCSPAPAAVRWPAFPKGGALFSAPVTLSWEPPRGSSLLWAETWAAARCQRWPPGAHVHPHSPHSRCPSPRVLSSAPCEPGRPSPGMERGGADRGGSPPSGSGGLSLPHLDGSLPQLWQKEARGRARSGGRGWVPRSSTYSVFSGQVSRQHQANPLEAGPSTIIVALVIESLGVFYRVRLRQGVFQTDL